MTPPPSESRTPPTDGPPSARLLPPLVPVSLAFLAGIVVATSLAMPALAWFVLGLFAAVVSATARRFPRVSFVALIVLWVSLGALRQMLWAFLPSNDVTRLVSEEPAPVAVHGIVADEPATSVDVHGSERTVCLIRTRHVRTMDGGWSPHLSAAQRAEPGSGSPSANRQVGGWHPATGVLRARFELPRIALAYGDEVVVEGRWSAVRGPGNPGQYDWRAALARQHIHALLSVEPFHGIVRLRAGQGAWWDRAIGRFRHRLETLIQRYFDEEHAGLLRSFLLGERVALEEDLKQAFIETGTMHLVVISGFNVGLIAGMLELFLRLLGLSLAPRLALSGISLFGYCLLTGMQPPVTRATIMAWMVLGALGLDRLINWPNTLAAAAMAILWVSPAQLYDPGFQLSFGAVASLMVFASRFRALIEPHLHLRPDRLTRYVAISLASTLAIWVGLWPVLAWYFHLVSPVSVLANLVLVPLVSVLVSVGTVVVMLGALLEPVVAWTSGVLTWLVDAIVTCVRWCRLVPLGWWPVGQPSWAVLGGYYALVMLSLARRQIRLSAGWLIACWLVGVNLWLWSEARAEQTASRWLEVTVLDVGHGDAIVIRTPSHHTLLIDTGTQEAGRYAVVPFLRHQGVQTLDALILTHSDEDHLGGALSVLRYLTVRRLFTSGFEAHTWTAQQVFELAHTMHVPYERLAAGMQLAGMPGIEAMILHPPPGFVPGTASFSNDNSLVMKLTKRDVGLLLCGDLEERGVPWLLRAGFPLGSMVLKVPHHGSALGAAGHAFFEQVHPRFAVISVGRTRGLPSKEVVRDLAGIGARVLVTRRDGAVTIRTDGAQLVVDTFR